MLYSIISNPIGLLLLVVYHKVVLGPLLFATFVNDIPHVVKSILFLFADDMKLSRSIICPEDIQILQDDIWCLFDWIDPNLKFLSHTLTTVTGANQMLGLISKCFHYLDDNSFLNLHKTFVWPILEYGNVIWGPHHALDQQSLKIQQRATKLIPSIRHLPYTDRLTFLKLPLLHYRRKRGDMILMYKIFHGHIDINKSIFTIRDTLSITRGHQYKIFKYPVHYNALQANFWVTYHWNLLPSDIVNATSINT